MKQINAQTIVQISVKTSVQITKQTIEQRVNHG